MIVNETLAKELGLDETQLQSPEMVAVFGGNALPNGATPIAQAYSGHQFGHFSPSLGDGRAVLLGEVRDVKNNLRDIQLKGAGPTPFSRRGDGRAAIGPVLREYLLSEAMQALGIPTTRALAAVQTGELVHRETDLPGAVLTRVARSHIRVGTFQYFAARDDVDALQRLTDYAIDRLGIPSTSQPPALTLFDEVAKRQISLVAKWLGVGFIHGVMNTDNTSISGETIDFGPCAFMNEYDETTVYSSIDRHGRYAYGAQKQIILWNLERLLEALLPIIHKDSDQAVAMAKERLTPLPQVMSEARESVFAAKLGIEKAGPEETALIEEFLKILTGSKTDFTNGFRSLCDAVESGGQTEGVLSHLPEYQRWKTAWLQRLTKRDTSPSDLSDHLRLVNPAYIPRNYLVENALAAAQDGDMQPFLELHDVLKTPYIEKDGRERYTHPPKLYERVRATFCGT